jgi:DNA repair exonuclease SbcCD nuclease subunit
MAEIEDSPFDYLALGHHHAAMKLVTNEATAAYCGSPTDTVGGAATYAMIEIEKGSGTKLEVLAIPGTETN